MSTCLVRLLIQFKISAQGMVPLVKMVLNVINVIKITITHRHGQSPICQVILDSVKLTMSTDHRTTLAAVAPSYISFTVVAVRSNEP